MGYGAAAVMNRLKVKEWARRAVFRGLPVPRLFKPAIRALYHLGVGFSEGWGIAWKIVWVEPVMRSLCERMGAGFRAERVPYIRGCGRLVLGDRVYLSGRSCFYFMQVGSGLGLIALDDGVFVGNGCTFSCGASISVGAGSLISTGVRIHDNDGHPIDAGRRRRGEPIVADECRPVIIGRNVWVGASAIVLKGVTIGDDAVIGAGAVVSRDVQSGAVVVGNPSKVIGGADASNARFEGMAVS